LDPGVDRRDIRCYKLAEDWDDGHDAGDRQEDGPDRVDPFLEFLAKSLFVVKECADCADEEKPHHDEDNDLTYYVHDGTAAFTRGWRSA